MPEEAAQRITDVKLTVASALQQVSDAVRAVPLDSVANAIRSGADAVGGALEEVTDLLGAIDDALGTAVDALQSALDEAETAVGTFTNAIEAVFADAADLVDGLNLDQVAGQIADGIDRFRPPSPRPNDAVLQHRHRGDRRRRRRGGEGRSRCCPNSMEEEVVAVARPIKQTDLNAFRLQLQGVLQIGDDGTFTLRPDLEAAVANIQAKMDALFAAAREHDPKHLAAALEPLLAELFIPAAISSAAPQLIFAPIRQALDQAKAAVTGIDPAASGAATRLRRHPRQDRRVQAERGCRASRPASTKRGRSSTATRLRNWRARLDESGAAHRFPSRCSI